MLPRPPYDVLDHANHIFSESLSSGDYIDRDEDLQKTNTKTKTPRHRQRQMISASKTQYMLRVAKCQFFSQIISVQLNLPQEKMRKLQELFDI